VKKVCLEEPPAACPRLEDVARAVVRQFHMYPGVEVALAKKDIDDAFKNVHLNLAGVPSYSTILVPIKGVDTPTIMMSSVLLFGAKHSPDWFGAAAWASVSAWRNMGAKELELNGANRFTGYIHVDDTVIVEPRLGNRLETAAAAYEWVARLVFGDRAINMEKDEIEVPRVSRCIGLTYKTW
jgi:hypothetical protein